MNPIDQRLLNHMSSVLESGCVTSDEMQRHLKVFTQKNFPDANPLDSAFYPKVKTIGANMYRLNMKSRYHALDEVNAIKMIDDWKSKKLDDFIYYRPMTEVCDVTESVVTDEENNVMYHVPTRKGQRQESSMLFIYMSAAQKYLFKRYNNLVLMDATYRTCRFAIPLFFLAVKTNSGYICVCSFIVQTEDEPSIAEALTLIRDHIMDHGIFLENFMVDYSAAEIGAIKKTFPSKLSSYISLSDLKCQLNNAFIVNLLMPYIFQTAKYSFATTIDVWRGVDG